MTFCVVWTIKRAMDASTVGDRVRDLRVRVPGLGPAEVDRLAGLPRGRTWKLEAERHDNPEAATARKLARVLGCTVGYLIDAEGEPPSSETVAAAIESARARLIKPAPKQRNQTAAPHPTPGTARVVAPVRSKAAGES